MKLVIISLITIIYIVVVGFLGKTVKKIGQNKSVNIYRVKYISKIISLVVTSFFITLVVIFLGIEYSQLSFFLSSVFAVIGVAMFAQWSILSNITASLIIFFAFPYRVGDRVKVVDKDEDISGVIEEISMFHVIIRRHSDLVTYPNSLILQKAVIKCPAQNATIEENLEGRED